MHTVHCTLYTVSLCIRSDGALEVVHYDDSTTRLPSAVQAEDIGVSDPLIISGSVIVSEGGPTAPTPDSEWCVAV